MGIGILSRAAAIAAVHELPPGRYPEYGRRTIQEYAMAEFLRVNPGLRDVVDGILVAPSSLSDAVDTDAYAHERLTDQLGFTPRFAETMAVGGATYVAMAARAATAIATGQADAVLCLGAGKFEPVSAGTGAAMAKMVSHPDFEYPYGAFVPAMYALSATRHMHERGTTREAMAQVAVTTREWALRHPDAIMAPKGALTVDDVLNSRLIASPFHLYDCSVPCEGGGVILVARADIARELVEQPAYIQGFGEFHDHGIISHSTDFVSMGASKAARAAFEMADLTPADVRVAELYDAFSMNPIWLLEETGLADPGKGGAVYLDGRAAPGGDLPVNTFGGLLSYGHTGDGSGMSMLIEAARQVMGNAEGRQVDADVALVHTYGGMMAEHCTMLLGRRS